MGGSSPKLELNEHQEFLQIPEVSKKQGNMALGVDPKTPSKSAKKSKTGGVGRKSTKAKA